MNVTLVGLVFAGLFSGTLHAANYQGQENRAIKSLSSSDIDSIVTGKGWGLAKAAELNGYPGPRHVLDLAKELNLSTDQEAQMSALFVAMEKEASLAGRRFVDAEKAIEQVFQTGAVEPQSLASLVNASAKKRAALRLSHLSYHLRTLAILSRHQVAMYKQLRGYNQGEHAHHKKH